MKNIYAKILAIKFSNATDHIFVDDKILFNENTER